MTEIEDTQPGPYYVVVFDTDSGRLGFVTAPTSWSSGLLLGPLDSHQEALDMLSEAAAKVRELDPNAASYSFGTAHKARGGSLEVGMLNRYFNKYNN